MLTKRCHQFETKINLAASHLLSLFSSKKKREKIEAQQVTPHKKCFLYSSESALNELDCILLDLRQFTTIGDLQLAFFGEIGVEFSSTQTVRMRFRDRTGTLVTVSRSTTIAQIIEHAEHLCFYRDTTTSVQIAMPINISQSSISTMNSSTNSLQISNGEIDTSNLNISQNNISQSNIPVLNSSTNILRGRSESRSAINN